MGGGVNQQQSTLKRAINFDLLRTLLGDDVADDEAYEFTWVGKKEAVMEAGRPIRKTLRPCPEESKSFDITENLYIEGDNLDVLKLLQESYLGKVKMIYIDPPYNTGNDFVYRDNFSQSREDYDEEAGVFDEDGERLFKNTESNGRFHSDWCSMIYPRLILARNLLRDDGVIFISIDDNEQENLRKICDEIFGENNFISNICHKNRDGVSNDKIISSNHNFILFYAKNYKIIHLLREHYGLKRTEEDFSNYKKDDNDGKGKYTLNPVTGPGGARKGNPYYEILGVTNYWRFSKINMEKLVSLGRILKINNNLYQKTYLKDLEHKKKGATTWWEVGTTSQGTNEIKRMFGDTIFDFAKPTALIKHILNYIEEDKNSIILDFFSGSATTAHAVMQLNAEDGGNRKFIMVQLPETTKEDSEAFKAGYKNICEIGKERIRRAGDKIKEENKDKENIENLDIGFRVLKLDDSNMKEVYYAAGDYTQDLLSLTESNIKDDRTDMDLLYGCLLDWGLPLSQKHIQEEVDGVTVHTYNDGDLMACFAEKVSETVVKEIAKRQPLRVVFRDSSFSSSPEKINVEEIFKLMAPNTTIKII